MDGEFEKELRESGYIHRPLPLHRERSLEERLKQKEILESRPLWEAGSGCDFICREQGEAFRAEEGEDTVIEVKAPLTCPCWPKGMPQDGDCAYYGKIHLGFSVAEEDWSSFHRIRLVIRPDCQGSRTVNLTFYLKNLGDHPVPDFYKREGFHLMPLKNCEWNECIWEFPSLPREQVCEFGIQYRLNGKDISSGDWAEFQIKSIRLEKIRHTEKEKGWLLEDGSIAYSTCGYALCQEKKAVFVTEEKSFQIESSNGDIVFKKELVKADWQGDTFSIGDFTEIKEPGTYRIVCGSCKSGWFPVGDQVLSKIAWKGLNFLFCERCGYPVPEKHGLCHMDTYGEHNGVKIPYCGGWHDAGDMSQQTVQTAETVESLLELAGETKGDTLLYQRLMEEALWGLEFILRTRFGDGFRCTSLGLIRWTDGKIGNEDDASNVRVHNHAMENLICAGVEALAGKGLIDYDRELAWACINCAREDFRFGLERFEQYGMELPVIWEHTYSSSRALYLAEITLTAARLYEVTGEREYLLVAAKYGTKLCACQKNAKEGEAGGYFCRDESLETAVHYTHQSREQIPVKALTLLLKLGRNLPDEPVWEKAVINYGRYMKILLEYASPYGMIPAGVYFEEEAEDEETFRLLHLQADYKREKEHYRLQVKAGIPLKGSSGGYIRQFPVWFSFRGNTAVLLSQAQAASMAAEWMKDEGLLRAAQSQIQWLLGKNPYARSFMYGVGSGYENLYCVFPGICTGQLPVGVESFGDNDEPYWPMGNNATYKEVWVSSLTKLFGILTEIYKTN